MVSALLASIICDFMLTGHMLRVATWYLGEHDVGTLMVAPIVLTYLPLHVVIRKHRVVQCDASLWCMAPFAFRFVIASLACTILVDAVDVDDALVASARLTSDLDHTLVATCLDRGLAQASSENFIFLSMATLA